MHRICLRMRRNNETSFISTTFHVHARTLFQKLLSLSNIADHMQQPNDIISVPYMYLCECVCVCVCLQFGKIQVNFLFG